MFVLCMCMFVALNRSGSRCGCFFGWYQKTCCLFPPTKELNLKMEMEDLIIHLSQSDAVLLSLLAQSLDSGPATAAGAGAGGDGTGSAGLWSDEGAEGARSRSSWEVKLKGISLRLLEGSEQKAGHWGIGGILVGQIRRS